jgi:hypothetical protein
MKARRLAIALLFASSRAFAQDNGKAPEYDESALKAALEEPAGGRKKTERAGSALEIPPPPPRKAGVVLEGSFGAMGFLGKLNTISPAASMLHLQLGLEIFRWFMVFGEGDISFTSTRYSPPSRGYAMYAFGGGGRLTLALSERIATYGQVDFGLMTASSNVLHSYGFYDAENWNGYLGATAGLEWYQADPHYALALYAGIRDAQGFTRAVSGDTALAWRGGASIRYTF